MRSTAGKLPMKLSRAKTMKHPSSHRILAIKSGLIGRLDACGTHFRYQSPSLIYVAYTLFFNRRVEADASCSRRRERARGVVRRARRTRQDKRPDLVRPRFV